MARLPLYGVVRAEATRRCCSSGVRLERLRQQVVCSGCLANSQIELREAEPLQRIVARTEPELRRMIGESSRVSCDQIVVAACRRPTPGGRFFAAAHFAENACELCCVIGIV